jgi:hypothetical protein
MSYSTYFLVTWTWTCMQAVIPSMLQHSPEPIASQYALQQCSCVIDKFREAVTEEELKMLTVEQRGEMGEFYARVCTGISKES